MKWSSYFTHLVREWPEADVIIVPMNVSC